MTELQIPTTDQLTDATLDTSDPLQPNEGYTTYLTASGSGFVWIMEHGNREDHAISDDDEVAVVLPQATAGEYARYLGDEEVQAAIKTAAAAIVARDGEDDDTVEDVEDALQRTTAAWWNLEPTEVAGHNTEELAARAVSSWEEFEEREARPYIATLNLPDGVEVTSDEEYHWAVRVDGDAFWTGYTHRYSPGELEQFKADLDAALREATGN